MRAGVCACAHEGAQRHGAATSAPPLPPRPSAHSVVRFCRLGPHSGGRVPLRVVLDMLRLVR